MTDWREELIEKMAKAAWGSHADDPIEWNKAHPDSRESYLREARAALDVAEPAIREQCAEASAAIAKEHLTDAVARLVAAAIRDSRNCVPEGGKE